MWSGLQHLSRQHNQGQKGSDEYDTVYPNWKQSNSSGHVAV